MKIKKLLTLAIVAFSSMIYAQNFGDVVNQIGNELKTVETKSNSITQTIAQPNNGVIEVTQTTTALKGGKSQTEVYVLNPADIDLNTIRTVTNKDVIEVQLLVKNKQQLIKKTVDHIKTSYVNAVMIPCADVNNGRALTDLFKSLVPLATDITEKRLSLTTYQDHLNWLTKEIGEVTVGEKQYGQTLSASSTYAGRLSFSVVEATAKSNKKSVYEFNAMNINPNSILFNISGETFSLEIQTKRKLNLVKYFVNDEQKNFTDKFEIICNSVEQARDIQKVLKNFVALSETEFNKNLPTVNSTSQAFSIINGLITKVTVNDITYSQSFSADCVTKFSKNEASASKNSVQEYEFNFADINKNTISYETSRQFLTVKLQTTAKEDLIKPIVDNTQKSYSNSFEIAVSEVEEAIIIENALKFIVEECSKNTVSFKNTSKQQLIQLLAAEVKNVTVGSKAINQTLEKSSSETGLSFKQIEVTEKSSKEKLYEFNYTDINPASVKMNTSGKNAYVVFNTRFNEKIIQYYEDGAIKNYQNSIRVEAESIENARKLVAILKELTDK